jgi:hypothetical protein
MRDGDGGAIVERLSAVDLFAPLSVEETGTLAQAAVRHVFAPGELVIRAGRPGIVNVRRSQRPRAGPSQRKRSSADSRDAQRRRLLRRNGLFTGEPRTANVVALEETEVLEIGHAR